ncbi:MAG: hypothetical protein HQ568_04520 [Calditrichaeota bacterium]|nr:hypothetical protein [Calditrichota bacterium]
MPGITFVLNYEKSKNTSESTFLESLGYVCHFENYEKQVFKRHDAFILGATFYKGYPIISDESDRYWLCIEGNIYGKSFLDIKSELFELAEAINCDSEDGKTKLSNWLLRTDGDFIVVIFDKIIERLLIFNDALGRLPLYYHQTDKKLIITREIAYLNNNIEDRTLDRMSMAQFLLFSYTLGKRTLFKNIHKLLPASLVTIDVSTSHVLNEIVSYFDFDKCVNSGESTRKNSSKLVSLFRDSCHNLIKNERKLVLSLSGGLDSRAVGAGLAKNGTSFSSASFLDRAKISETDVKIAEQVAAVFNSDWKTFRLNHPRGKDIHRLLKLKYGQAYLGVSFILLYMEHIKQDFGSNFIFLTGDGGDRLLHNLMPNRKMHDLDDLANCILSDHQIFSLDTVAELVQISKEEIINDLLAHISKYPERSLNNKYVHFMIYDRAINSHFEGEDRNRFYCWSETPFYSIKFFDYAMNCPSEQKTHFGLYSRFLKELSYQAANLETNSLKLPITSTFFKAKRLACSMFPRLPELKKKFVKDSTPISCYSADSNWLNYIREVLCDQKTTKMQLDPAKVENVINNSHNYSKYAIENLFTLTALIDQLDDDSRSILRYADTTFE